MLGELTQKLQRLMRTMEDLADQIKPDPPVISQPDYQVLRVDGNIKDFNRCSVHIEPKWINLREVEILIRLELFNIHLAGRVRMSSWELTSTDSYINFLVEEIMEQLKQGLADSCIDEQLVRTKFAEAIEEIRRKI